MWFHSPAPSSPLLSPRTSHGGIRGRVPRLALSFVCHWSFLIPLSLLLVQLHALGAFVLLLFLLFPTPPWLYLLRVGGFRFFSSSYHAFSSLIGLLRLSLWLLVLSVWGLLRCPGLSSDSSSRVVSFGFTSRCSGFSFPLSFRSVCVPGYGAFLFPTPSFPYRVISGGSLSMASLRQFVTLLPVVLLSFSVHFNSFWGTWPVFCLVPRLSFVSSSLSGLLLLCRFISSSFRILSVLRLYIYWGFPPSRPSFFLLSGWRLVFPHDSSPSGSPSSTASACHRRLLLSLFAFPSSCGVTVSLYCPFLLFGVVSTCLHDLLLLGFLLFIRLGTWVLRCPSSPLSLGDTTFFLGFTSSSFTASAFLFVSPWVYFFRASVVMPCDFLSAFYFSVGLHPDVSASAFPGYCLIRSSVILFLSVCVCAWSACLAFPRSSSAFLGLLSSLSFRLVTSFPSLGALLTRSNLRYTLRRCLPLGRVSYCLASFHSSFAGLRTPSVLFSMSPSSCFSSTPFTVCGLFWLPFPRGSSLLLVAVSSFPIGLVLGFLGIAFPVGFLAFRLGSSLLVSPPVGFPFRVSSACSSPYPRSVMSISSSVFPSFVTRSNLGSFATGSSLRAESLLSVFSCILSPGFTSCPLLLVSFFV